MLNGLGMSFSDFVCDLIPLCGAGSMVAQGVGESQSASDAAAANGGVLPSGSGLSTTEWLLIGGAAVVALYFFTRRK